MRYVVYLFVIANVILGFVLIYGRKGPLKGKTYRDYIKNSNKRV